MRLSFAVFCVLALLCAFVIAAPVPTGGGHRGGNKGVKSKVRDDMCFNSCEQMCEFDGGDDCDEAKEDDGKCEYKLGGKTIENDLEECKDGESPPNDEEPGKPEGEKTEEPEREGETEEEEPENPEGEEEEPENPEEQEEEPEGEEPEGQEEEPEEPEPVGTPPNPKDDALPGGVGKGE